jgi:endonuclease YncB( thermonuclease family)
MQNITWDDTIEFTYPITSGHVIKVYDGDTITIASKMPYENSPLFRFSVRLDGIDTPEIKSKDKNEKALAILARDSLLQLIINKNVTLKNVKNEKYGRILADVFLHDLHINKWMIEQKFAVEYDGKTKKLWGPNINTFEDIKM